MKSKMMDVPLQKNNVENVEKDNVDKLRHLLQERNYGAARRLIAELTGSKTTKPGASPIQSNGAKDSKGQLKFPFNLLSAAIDALEKAREDDRTDVHYAFVDAAFPSNDKDNAKTYPELTKTINESLVEENQYRF